MIASAKKLYDERKTLGLCIACGKNPARDGKVKCKDCAEQHQSARLVRCLKAKEDGLCTKCHKIKAVSGRSRCEKCRDQLCTLIKRRNRRSKEKGICTACNSNKAMPGRTKCEKCAVYHMAWVAGTTYETIMEIWNKQKGICAYTGIKLVLGYGASIDHKIPRSRGGSDEASNLQWISDAANRAKLTMTDQEYRDFIELNYLYQHKVDAVL